MVTVYCGKEIIMIHLFIPELREKYQLEELWSKGKIIDLKIDVAKEDLL